jgi:hypothetical protein
MYYSLASVNLAYGLSEGGTEVPKHVVVVKVYTDVFVISAFIWFCERIF